MLLIDLGNTAIKTRWIEQGRNYDRTFRYRASDSMEKMQNYLQTLSVNAVYIASVAEEDVLQSVMTSLRKPFNGTRVQLLNTLPELDGLVNGYENYRQLGVDRWLAILAIYDQAQTDCMIIDAGSAITIDLLSLDRGFIGGAILPGLNTDLNRFKQIFPGIDFDSKKINTLSDPGRNTLDCLYNPGTPVSVEVIQNILKSWEGQLEKPCKLILTGQDADIISHQMPGQNEVIPDLVFKGMLKQIQLLR